MKILKIFGIVVGIHAAVFLFIFAIPGCRSTGKPAAATGDAVAPAAPPASSPASPADADPNRVSPTRPGTSEALAFSKPEVIAPIAPPTPTAPAAATHTVARGDSLWSIAKKYGVTVASLAAANNLSTDATLRLNQKLLIPGTASTVSATAATAAPAGTTTYTVKTGDTLGLIARRAGTTAAALRTMNNLSNDSIHVGQVLHLPEVSPSALAAATPAAAHTDEVTYTVKAGDTLGAIARQLGVKQGDLATLNNITNPAKISPGMVLKVPGYQKPSTATKPSTAGAKEPVETAPVAPVAPPATNYNFKLGGGSSSTEPAPMPPPNGNGPQIQIEDSGAHRIP